MNETNLYESNPAVLDQATTLDHQTAIDGTFMNAAFSLPTDRELRQITAAFGLLSDGKRLAILFKLLAGEQNVSWLTQHLNLAQPAVSHHLGLLRNAGVVVDRRVGKQVFYSLNGPMSFDQTQLKISMENYSISLNSLKTI